MGEIRKLVLESGLYSDDFIKNYGRYSKYWSGYSWREREFYLRHQMVCLLLCNLAVRRKRKADSDQIRTYVYGEGSSSGSSIDLGMKDEDVDIEYAEEALESELNFRYDMIEGKSSPALFQNQLCNQMGITKKEKLYDIGDNDKKKLIEVKVTINLQKIKDKLYDFIEDQDTYLIHIHPETTEHWASSEEDELPGLEKAKMFLLTRRAYMLRLGIVGFDRDHEESYLDEVFCCGKLNYMTELWKSYFWDKIGPNPNYGDSYSELYKSYSQEQRPIIIEERTLKSLIEDTTLRNEDFMLYHGKILPPYICLSKTTESETDMEMVLSVTEDMKFEPGIWLADAVMECMNAYKASQNHWTFLDVKGLNRYPNLKKALGVGVKTEIRYDDHPDLVQKEFPGRSKARYSGWLSHMITELSQENDVSYFPEFLDSEIRNIHTLSQLNKNITDAYFKMYSTSNTAQFASSIKNIYSRLSGAYANSGNKRSNKQVLVFPIYSVGKMDNKKVREIHGFCIRGPAHPKKPTDRIPIITCERLNPAYNKYKPFIKKAVYVDSSDGTTWLIRQNSVQKCDLTYLTYINNALYLSANMLGELMIDEVLLDIDDVGKKAVSFMQTFKSWILERVTEGVMMAILGGSCEEGTMAIVRKIFMLKLNWDRKENAYGWNTKGLADAINECLWDSPLALYMAKQIRDTLRE